MRIISLAVLSSLAVSGIANAAERSLFLKSGDVKGYGKRDRVFFSSDQTVAPSQLHEIYGARVDAGFQYDSSRSRYSEDKAKTTSPTAAVRGYWSGDALALGLGGSFSNASTSTGNAGDFSESVKSRKLLPAAALSITPNVTVGASTDVNWISINQKNNDVADQNFKSYMRRDSVGVSYHNPKLEVGVAYVTATEARMTADETVNSTTGFGLYQSAEAGARDIYLPAHGTVFARGNLTDQFSMQGTLSQVQYDANKDKAKAAIFEDYRSDDRLAGQLQGVYWMSDLATRLALTASYQGATFAPYGTVDNGLGYRDANLYGASVDGAIELRERTYLGLSVGYLRGERNQDVGEARAVAREDRAKIATTINVNI
ncbi:MAG: hypothetical protein NTV34_01840 [Proteobacteria bacterium]|nr:hypothetical protein [Pseudomonadota bacterium]